MSLVIDFVLVVGDVYTFYNPYTPERTCIGNKADKALIRSHPNVVNATNRILHEVAAVFQVTLCDFTSVVGIIDNLIIVIACYTIGFCVAEGISIDGGPFQLIAYATHIGNRIDILFVGLIIISNCHHGSFVEIPVVGLFLVHTRSISIVPIGNNIAAISLNTCRTTTTKRYSHRLTTGAGGQFI